MQVNSVKAMSVCAEAIKTLVKPKIPKGSSSKLSHFAFIAHRLGNGLEATWPRVVGSANQSPRIKPRQRPQLQLRLPKFPGRLYLYVDLLYVYITTIVK